VAAQVSIVLIFAKIDSEERVASEKIIPEMDVVYCDI